MLSKEYLLSLFELDHKHGLLIWRKRPVSMFKDEHQMKCWNTKNAGKAAGSKFKNGYLVTSLNKKKHYVHRLIMAILGHDVDGLEVDHINGDRADNRPENLRLVERWQNSRNTKNRKSETGICGVFYEKRNLSNPWYVKYNGNTWGGSYPTKDDAIAARDEINKKFNYSETHGKRK